jgi:hypothetical protein
LRSTSITVATWSGKGRRRARGGPYRELNRPSAREPMRRFLDACYPLQLSVVTSLEHSLRRTIGSNY